MLEEIAGVLGLALIIIGVLSLNPWLIIIGIALVSSIALM